MLRSFISAVIRGSRRSQVKQTARTPARFTPGLEALDAREVPAVLGLTSAFAHTAAVAHTAPLHFELENVLVSN